MSRLTLKLRRVGAILSCVAVFGTLGGYWVVPQAVTWGQMFAEYSQQTHWVRAAIEIVSGEKLCGVCHRISAAKQERKNSPAALSLLKVDLCLAPDQIGRLARVGLRSERAIPAPVNDALIHSIPPPTPPPRIDLITG